jgi:membrane fusion protein (multidrug efflux system)
MVQQVTYRIQAVGSLEAEDLVQVTAEVDGVLTEVKFREGDRVGPNTVIALIDPDRYKLEAERAAANYRRAVADGAQAEATLARREALARENLVSVEDLNQTRTASERLAAEVAAVKAARDIAAQNLSRAFVKPRRGGVIDKRLVATGTFVRAGTNLATLVDLARLQLRFRVSETESLRVNKGQEAKFKVAATGDREFAARVYHVGEVADPASRQVEVLAWVENPGVLKPGFFAEVSLPSDSKKDAIVVPETAIRLHRVRDHRRQGGGPSRRTRASHRGRERRDSLGSCRGRGHRLRRLRPHHQRHHGDHRGRRARGSGTSSRRSGRPEQRRRF